MDKALDKIREKIIEIENNKCNFNSELIDLQFVDQQMKVLELKFDIENQELYKDKIIKNKEKDDILELVQQAQSLNEYLIKENKLNKFDGLIKKYNLVKRCDNFEKLIEEVEIQSNYESKLLEFKNLDKQIKEMEIRFGIENKNPQISSTKKPKKNMVYNISSEEKKFIGTLTKKSYELNINLFVSIDNDHSQIFEELESTYKLTERCKILNSIIEKSELFDKNKEEVCLNKKIFNFTSRFKYLVPNVGVVFLSSFLSLVVLAYFLVQNDCFIRLFVEAFGYLVNNWASVPSVFSISFIFSVIIAILLSILLIILVILFFIIMVIIVLLFAGLVWVVSYVVFSVLNTIISLAYPRTKFAHSYKYKTKDGFVKIDYKKPNYCCKSNASKYTLGIIFPTIFSILLVASLFGCYYYDLVNSTLMFAFSIIVLILQIICLKLIFENCNVAYKKTILKVFCISFTIASILACGYLIFTTNIINLSIVWDYIVFGFNYVINLVNNIMYFLVNS